MKSNAAMEQPMNGNNGEGVAAAWVILTGFMAGVAKFFDNYLLADTFIIATLKAGVAAGFIALCAAAGNFAFKLIKPIIEKKVEKFKNKNKTS